MIQKNQYLQHRQIKPASNFKDSKLQYKSTKQTPIVCSISFNFHSKLNQVAKHLNYQNRESKTDKNKQQLSLTLRSTMYLNSIKKLTKLKKLKTQQNLEYKKQYDKQNMLIHKIKIIQLYRAGNFSKVYKALLKNPNCMEVVVKKIIIDPNHQTRQQYFAKTLNNPYIVNFIGTYATSEKQNKKQTKINKMLKDRFEIDNEIINEEVKYLNIVMTKYSNNLCQILQLENMTPHRIKIYLYQMLRAIAYIHSLNICHRDIKPHNFVIKNNRIYLCDFGAAKMLQKDHKSVSYIFSRQYRAPELLFEFQSYDKSVDIWAMGCVAAQMILKKPLFNGANNLDQLVKILRVFGTPKWQIISFCKDKKIPRIPQIIGTGLKKILQTNCDELLMNLIEKMMRLEPKERYTAIQALCDPYFDQIRDQTFYRNHLRETNLPNFFYFDKKQIKGNEHFLSKLVPYWLKQHCKRFEVSIKDYKF